MDFRFKIEGAEADFDHMLIIDGDTHAIENLTIELFDPETNEAHAFFVLDMGRLDQIIDALEFARDSINAADYRDTLAEV